MINKLKQDQLMYRKEKLSEKLGFNIEADENAKLLSTLISDCMAVGKKSQRDPTDEECIAVIKSFLKKANETLKVNDNSTTKTEIKLLESYLPKQLTDEEINKLLFDFKHGEREELKMGDYMRIFKTQYNGQYDGKQLSTLVREFLK